MRYGLGAIVVLLGMGLAASALAGEVVRTHQVPNPTPYYPTTQNRFAHVPPGHERFYAQPVPAYPTLDRGAVVPTYNWGYFGARYRPRMVGQQGYYDEYRQWSFRPGW
jgi:hypothetical protein